MADNSDSTLVASNGNGNPLVLFGKYGLPGLVIAVLFYFSWFNMNKVSAVVEKNTEAMVEVKGAVGQMKEALRDNTESLSRLREERREDRAERRGDRAEDRAERRGR